MGLKEDTQEALCSLKLSDIPNEWMNSLWDGNFCNESVTLPYHAVEEAVLLCEEGWEGLVEACKRWTQANDGKLLCHCHWLSVGYCTDVRPLSLVAIGGATPLFH